MDAGVELMALGARGIKRELVLDLETSALTPEMGEIIRFRAVNRWDENDQFDEWVKPSQPLSVAAEQVTGITNQRLADCRPIHVALSDFLDFIDGAALLGEPIDFDLKFLMAAIARRPTTTAL